MPLHWSVMVKVISQILIFFYVLRPDCGTFLPGYSVQPFRPLHPSFPSKGMLLTLYLTPFPSWQLPSKRTELSFAVERCYPCYTTPWLCQQAGSHSSRGDGKTVSCMFLLTICFRKQERKQRAFAAPSVSVSHAARLGYSQLLQCQAVTR